MSSSSHHHLPQLHKTKTPKAPSAAEAAAQQLLAHIAAWGARWELDAVVRGSPDPGAHLQAAKSLQQLVQHLGQHRHSCRRGEVRSALQKAVPAPLVTTLLASSHGDTLGIALPALAQLSRLAPLLVPLEAAPRLLQLLCSASHGAAAARLLLQQLSHWRFSQLWRHWLAADTTAALYSHLQHLAAVGDSGAGGSTSSTTAARSKAVEAVVSCAVLLARLMELGEQQVVQQLAGDTATATRCAS
jgi:hypothetical protein